MIFLLASLVDPGTAPTEVNCQKVCHRTVAPRGDKLFWAQLDNVQNTVSQEKGIREFLVLVRLTDVVAIVVAPSDLGHPKPVEGFWNQKPEPGRASAVIVMLLFFAEQPITLWLE
jgi:hypothetical protein